MSVERPLVSVIVRTKDRPEQLQNCLESIAKQDYRPIQVVLINDGGADVSNIAYPFKPDLKITGIHLKENEGRTAAANHGLNSAQGDYICFLDDDDYWLPNHLSSLVTHLFSAPLNVNTDSNLPDVAIYSATKAVLIGTDSQEQEIKTYSVDFDRQHLLYNNFLPILSVLFSRSVIDAGVRFDNTFDLFEDWDFWLQVSQRIPFIATPDTTCVYRLHEQASGVHDAEQATKAFQAIYKKWLGDYSATDMYELLRKTHQWHDESVDSLQQVNQKKMTSIGEQHAYALSVIDIKDTNITTLEKLYKHAVKVIKRKDLAAEQLAKDYAHAIEVIKEKDQATEQLAKDYTHAIDVIQEKDQTTKQLTKDYTHAIKVIQEKDQIAKQLTKDYTHAIEVIQEKDQIAEQQAKDYAHAISVIQKKDQAAEQLAKDYAHAIKVIQEKDLAAEQLAKDYSHAIEVTRGKDQATDQLTKDHANTSEIIKQKELAYKQLNSRYESSIQNTQLMEKTIEAMKKELSDLQQEVEHLQKHTKNPLKNYIKRKLGQ